MNLFKQTNYWMIPYLWKFHIDSCTHDRGWSTGTWEWETEISWHQCIAYSWLNWNAWGNWFMSCQVVSMNWVKIGEISLLSPARKPHLHIFCLTVYFCIFCVFLCWNLAVDFHIWNVNVLHVFYIFCALHFCVLHFCVLHFFVLQFSVFRWQKLNFCLLVLAAENPYLSVNLCPNTSQSFSMRAW